MRLDTHSGNKSLYINFLVLIFVPAFFASCNKEVKSQDELAADSLSIVRKNDSLLALKVKEAQVKYPKINYSLIELKGGTPLLSLLKPMEGENDTINRKRIIATLNRKEFRYIYGGTSVLVPDTFVADMRAYSVFPYFYPGAVKIPKIIMVSNKFQSYACYEYGNLVRFAAANTGKERTPSYPGRYALVWREYKRKSSLDETWIMPYTYNFHNEAGSAFHQFAMPGKPVSHSCVRQFMEDAKWLFYWGQGGKRDSSKRFIPFSGTPVIIIDHYDFGRKRGSWLELTSNKDSIIQLPPDPMAVEEALIPIIQIPKESRGILRNKARYLYAEDTLRARGVIRQHVKLTPSINYNKLREQKAAAKARRLQEMQNNNIENSTTDSKQ